MAALGGVCRQVELTSRRLAGFLTAPPHPHGLVIFAHGAGSSRFSRRNQTVARRLHAAGLATLLFDLLSESESEDRGKVFDIELLAGRLREAANWARACPDTKALPIGYFGASTGAGAALAAAADDGESIAAVVSRGGRPDLAGADALRRVRSPTLLIVGSRDVRVLELNEKALAELGCEARLEVVTGASHLFEEEGTLERAAELAAGWFRSHFQSAKGG